MKSPVPIVQSPPAPQPAIAKSAELNAVQPDITPLTGAITNIEELLSVIANKDIEVRAPIPVSQAPSSPLLIQHTQNQAAIAGQATVQAQAQAPEKPVNVNNHVDVKVESKPVELYIDGEKVGSAALRWIERQNLRNGVSAF